MHQIEQQRQEIGGELKSKHEEEVAMIRSSHQKELESKISSIQNELDRLLSLSKGYWDKHAEAHNVEIHLGANHRHREQNMDNDDVR